MLRPPAPQRLNRRCSGADTRRCGDELAQRFRYLGLTGEAFSNASSRCLRRSVKLVAKSAPKSWLDSWIIGPFTGRMQRFDETIAVPSREPLPQFAGYFWTQDRRG